MKKIKEKIIILFNRAELSYRRNPLAFLSKTFAIIFAISFLDFMVLEPREKEVIRTLRIYEKVNIYHKQSGFWGEIPLNGKIIKLKIPIDKRSVSGVDICNIINEVKFTNKYINFINKESYEFIEQIQLTKSECK